MSKAGGTLKQPSSTDAVLSFSLVFNVMTLGPSIRVTLRRTWMLKHGGTWGAVFRPTVVTCVWVWPAKLNMHSRRAINETGDYLFHKQPLYAWFCASSMMTVAISCWRKKGLPCCLFERHERLEFLRLDLDKVRRIVFCNQPNAVRPDSTVDWTNSGSDQGKTQYEVGHALLRGVMTPCLLAPAFHCSGFYLSNYCLFGRHHETLFANHPHSIFSDMDAANRLGLER